MSNDFSTKQVLISRPSFTLVEMLIVLAIISILASAVLTAMYGVVEEAKVARTKAQVAKLHELIMSQLEGYGTRPIRLSIPSNTTENVVNLATTRLWAIRDLMRMEVPDRITDLNYPATPITMPKDPKFGGGTVTVTPSTPSKWRSHRRRAGYASAATTIKPASWTYAFQGAECLYLTVASIRDGESTGLDYFQESEIGDVDGDGMREILDAWGRPIEFVRWAPGYVSELQPNDPAIAPDPFDPLGVDNRPTFRLVPLIFSPGPDGAYGVAQDYDTNPSTAATDIDDPNFDHYISRNSSPPNDPYHTAPGLGNGFGDATPASFDNISNHLLDES